MPRPPKYPLDVNPQFTTLEQQMLGRGIAPVGNVAGVIHTNEGDLHAYVVYEAVRQVWKQNYTATAYADLIDANVVSLQGQTASVQSSLADLHARIASLQQTCESLAVSVGQIVSSIGVVIPAWVTKEEVERGDDMGLARKSAVDLGLTVVFVESRQVPGFGQDDVVALDPPAGSLVLRGSTVTVTLDIEG